MIHKSNPTMKTHLHLANVLLRWYEGTLPPPGHTPPPIPISGNIPLPTSQSCQVLGAWSIPASAQSKEASNTHTHTHTRPMKAPSTGVRESEKDRSACPSHSDKLSLLCWEHGSTKQGRPSADLGAVAGFQPLHSPPQAQTPKPSPWCPPYLWRWYCQ